MPNQDPLREFWLIKQALCAGINNAVAMWKLWCAQRPAVSLMHAVNALITQVKTTALGAVDRPLFRDVGSKNWAPVLLISDTHQICPARPQAGCWVIQQRTKWIETMKAFKCDTLNTVFYTYFSQHRRLPVNVNISIWTLQWLSIKVTKPIESWHLKRKLKSVLIKAAQKLIVVIKRSNCNFQCS